MLINCEKKPVHRVKDTPVHPENQKSALNIVCKTTYGHSFLG